MFQKACFNHIRYGECDKDECKYSHSGKAPNQEYFLAELLSKKKGLNGGTKPELRRILRSENEKKETFFVPKVLWKDDLIEEGDCLLFQASEFIDKNSFLRYGKVLKVLGKVPLIAGNLQKSKAFTIDSENTKIRDDAFTIEKCERHRQCFRLGIHVIPAALQNVEKIGEDKLPSGYSKVNSRWMPTENFGFNEGDTALALSLFSHTFDNTKSEVLEFTAIKITNSFTWENIQTDKDRERFLHEFVKNRGKEWLGFNDLFPKHIEQRGENWKWSHVCEVLMEKYWSAVRRTFPEGLFIGREWKRQPEYDKQDVVLFKDDILAILNADSSQDYSVLCIAARGMRFRKGICLLNAKAGVGSCYGVDHPGDDVQYKIQCTSPIRVFFQFINQQIVINHLLQNHDSLYSREELFGLMTERYETPCLAKAIVTNVGHNFAWLRYTELPDEDGSFEKRSTKLTFLPTFANNVSRNMTDRKVEITFEEMSCENYFNRELVKLSAEDYNKLCEKLSKLSRKEISKNDIRCQMKQAPYRQEERNTVLTLEPGVEIQLQVSNNELNEGPSGIRALRIGRNCNFCFIHANHPDLAFRSRRYDIRQRGTNGHTQSCKKIIARVKNVTINWTDRYYGGGSFETHKDVQEGDLLCVFANDYENSGENYIWNCHGVVFRFENERASFLTCSLSQTENCRDNDRFSIQILRESEI